MLHAVLLEDETYEAADAAWDKLTSSFFDLNEIRAGDADSPESSIHTSAHDRIVGARQRQAPGRAAGRRPVSGTGRCHRRTQRHDQQQARAQTGSAQSDDSSADADAETGAGDSPGRQPDDYLQGDGLLDTFA